MLPFVRDDSWVVTFAEKRVEVNVTEIKMIECYEKLFRNQKLFCETIFMEWKIFKTHLINAYS